MNAETFRFESLSDDQLLAETKRLVACERSATAAVLRSLMEIDSRRLYLREGCASLFTYCTQVLHLGEGAAYNRIEAARAARRFPDVLVAVGAGFLTLASVRLLAPHLTIDNHRELIDRARHKSKREVELLVAAVAPRQPVATIVRRVADRSGSAAAWGTEQSLMPPEGRGVEAPTHRAPECARPAAPSFTGTRAMDTYPASRAVSKLTPLSASCYRLQVTLSEEAHAKLRRAQDLLRHAIPNGDIATVLDRALTLLVTDLERRRHAATPAPRSSPESTGRGRHVPAAVKRAVWRRDEGRCAFVGRSGRCAETAWLEFHHVQPYADGGRSSVDNIQLRCRAHNQYEAKLWFESDVDEVRETSEQYPVNAAWLGGEACPGTSLARSSLPAARRQKPRDRVIVGR